MADMLTIETRGLRTLQGHFATYADHGLQRRRDEALQAAGKTLKARLKDTAPRSALTIGQHFADLFTVSAVRAGQGGTATVTIANLKTVTSASGVTYPLAQLLIMGTKAHDIFPVTARALHFVADGGDVFTGVVHHPGTAPSDFVQRAIQSSTIRADLARVAGKVTADLAGGATTSTGSTGSTGG